MVEATRRGGTRPRRPIRARHIQIQRTPDILLGLALLKKNCDSWLVLVNLASQLGGYSAFPPIGKKHEKTSVGLPGPGKARRP